MLKSSLLALPLALLLCIGCGGSNEPVQTDPDTTSEKQDDSALLYRIWQLEAFGDHYSGTPPIVDTEVTIEFFATRLVRGYAGCNSFNGGYEVGRRSDRATLAFSDMATTRMACLEAIMDQENRFLELLGSTVYYEVRDNILSLLDHHERELLRFAGDAQPAP